MLSISYFRDTENFFSLQAITESQVLNFSGNINNNFLIYFQKSISSSIRFEKNLRDMIEKKLRIIVENEGIIPSPNLFKRSLTVSIGLIVEMHDLRCAHISKSWGNGGTDMETEVPVGVIECD